jgi:hypothetical protein
VTVDLPPAHSGEPPPAPGELTAHPGPQLEPGPFEPVDEDWEPEPDRRGRPTKFNPQQLGFTPRRAVPWLSPFLLAGTAVRVILAELFGAYLDKRELQNALPGRVFNEFPLGADGQPDPNGEQWLDYVADLGDGFNATYSIAYLLAQPQLTVAGQVLPRGRVLVMGGDQVYPTASGQQYEDRFKGPYQAALPCPPPDGPQPTLYALPGNHDWYDGLTAFLRLFARAQGKVGGWRTRQSRSYFAMQLPNRWWLFAIDEQFGAYLDDPQLRYFNNAARHLRPGDKVIICPPSPDWVAASSDPQAFDTLDYFMRKVLAPHQVEVRLMISGDLHHYARYTGPGRELITFGGGGAYLYGTNHLPEKLEVPPKETLTRNASPPEEYRLVARYPTKWRSRWLAAGIFGRLPWRNPGFVGLLAIVHVLLMLAFANAAQRVSGIQERLVTIPLVLTVLLAFGGAVAFAMPPTAGHRRPRHVMLGSLHGIGHLAIAAAGTYIWLQLPFFTSDWPAPLILAVVIYAPIAGLVASLWVSGYLLLAGAFNVNVNELFAAQGIPDAKGFLRMHFAADGTLTIYPIGVDRTSRKWRVAPDAAPDKPWLEPVEPLVPKLVETAPITIQP